MNITDVDDKTIRGAREAGCAAGANLPRHSSRRSSRIIETLRIKRADEFPAATEPAHIAKMIEMIETVDRARARVSSRRQIGLFPHQEVSRLRTARAFRSHAVAIDRPGAERRVRKENIGDFALWKAWDEEDGDVAWESPWGRGRPGWHIECSAMATELLGEQLDIHCGGVDNIFPHHEAEIAQTEGCTGKQFVRYWLHCAHLIVDGQKMSKSLGNFYTLRDVLGEGYSGREMRYALMRVHYRAPLNFTWEGMDEARQSLARIDDWLARLRERRRAATSELPSTNPPSEQFEQALDDDLNISAALGFLFETIRETNRALDPGDLAAPAARTWLQLVGPHRSCACASRDETAIAGRDRKISRRRECRRGLQKIGEKVMNCATN